ncbi:putative kinase inhibitor [mine drainage metagenome]|jgi:Raf kinase inhibitor-like YbhB/YbcL family protein|uniref:Putative kinase inhibitor n=1 Tax=mine drainage metagenome TaxID=410659 RepID=A0A1J5RGS6_9ZZZZ
MHRTTRTAALAGLLAALAAPAAAFEVASASLRADGSLGAAQAYDRNGCGGANVSPELHWRGAPPATRGYALTLFDPDARGGRGWWHWLVLDLPATQRALAAGAALPGGARAWRNSFGEAGYGGPCPPIGDPAHHYVLTIYALRDAKLLPPPDADAARVAALLQADALASARWVGRYAR